MQTIVLVINIILIVINLVLYVINSYGYLMNNEEKAGFLALVNLITLATIMNIM